MKSLVDVLFIVPGNPKAVFQKLGEDFSAIEPPALAGLFANYLRLKNCSALIADMPGMGMEVKDVLKAIEKCKPVLIVVVVQGHQPSASTQNMPAASEVCRAIKVEMPECKIMMVGTHPSALPERTLNEECVDFVCEGEGPVTIYETLLAFRSVSSDFSKVSNLWYRDSAGHIARSKKTAPLINDLDEEFDITAWDLLPMGNYRAHNWHCFENVGKRKPYAAIYTSFGCPFSCIFCCINAPFGKSSYRMFSPDRVIKEIDILVNRYGVRNIKIVDEMFVLNEAHVLGICDRIIERGYDLNIWAYARVDTIKDKFLERLRKAGFRWLALGIESGSKHVRNSARKKFSNEDVIKVARKIQKADIYVGANYIFGLPDDTLDSMQETLDLALEINAEWANFYCAMAYPGSALYRAAKGKLPLPDDEGGPGWIGYSQHAYECLPLPTDKLSAAEVLRFRDKAFQKYFSSASYLNMIHAKFGKTTAEHIRKMSQIILKRKLLE
ncbi:MAG: B12-binding domain-containing radical SAM protein [Candidatus Wolfebacteria bacterium]|nr:B12-binding domain-containing radical SAM protein [Candidatus Wolfebacteria bacterium]